MRGVARGRKKRRSAEQGEAPIDGELSGRPFHVLSIDGGPAALLQVRMLRKLERAQRGFLAATDVFVGTSFGSMISMFIASRLPSDYSEAVELSPAILDDAIEFSDEIIRAMQPTALSTLLFLLGVGPIANTPRLVQVIRDAVGDMRLGDLSRMAIIASMSLNRFSPRSFRWLKGGVSNDPDMLLADAMLASGSLPLFVELFGDEAGDHFLDGAFVANNPSMLAVSHLLTQTIHRGRPRQMPVTSKDLERCRVLSLGVNDELKGLHASLVGNCKLAGLFGDPLAPGNLPWGFLQFFITRPLLVAQLLYQGQNGEVADQCTALLGTRHHFRYAPRADAFAEASEVFTGDGQALIESIERDAEMLWSSRGGQPASPDTRKLVDFVSGEWVRSRESVAGS